MTTVTEFARYLSRFLSEYLPHERNMSKNTQLAYRDAFVLFISFMKSEKKVTLENLELSHITRENVLEWLKWLRLEKKCRIATGNYRLAAMRSFVSYLQYIVVEKVEEWQKVLSIKSVRTESGPPNYLSAEGIRLLLAQPDPSTWQGRRHLAVLSLMYDTGARVQEVADIKVEDLRIDNEPYTIRLFGKGRKARIVPLMKEQIVILKPYIEENKLDRNVSSPLFFNGRHEKLTRQGISHILKTYADMARKENPGLIPGRISCHSLRHSKAIHLLQAGVNIVYIRDLLGHVSIETTSIYARVDSKAKREALRKAYSGINPSSECAWERDKNLLTWLRSFGH